MSVDKWSIKVIEEKTGLLLDVVVKYSFTEMAIFCMSTENSTIECVAKQVRQ